MSDTPEIKLIIDREWPRLTVYIKNRERSGDVDNIISAIRSFTENRLPSILAESREGMEMVPTALIF